MKKLDLSKVNIDDFLDEIKEIFGDNPNLKNPPDLHIEPDMDDSSVGYCIGRSIFINSLDGHIISFNKFKNFPVLSVAMSANGSTPQIGCILNESQLEKLIDFLTSKLREFR